MTVHLHCKNLNELHLFSFSHYTQAHVPHSVSFSPYLSGLKFFAPQIAKRIQEAVCFTDVQIEKS